jgi:O-succinylbenzoate synthase
MSNLPYPFLEHLWSAPLQLTQMEWIAIDLPQKEVFQSGIGKRTSKQTIIIKVVDKNGHIGYGECPCRPDPFYSAEFLDAVKQLLEQFILTMLTSSKTYGAFQQNLNKIRGWPFAKAAVDFALLSLLSHRMPIFENIPWSRTIQIPPGISLGLKTAEARIQQAVQKKYKRLKFKINPAFPLDKFKELNLAQYHIPLLFDANGTLSLNDEALIKEIANMDIAIEQPFPPGRLDWCMEAKTKIPSLKICLDEEIKSIGQLKIAHQLSAVDEVNLKPGRVGGLLPSLQIIEYCTQHHIDCWIGGMFETGFGRITNMQFAALLPNAKAHDISPASRYFEEDIIQNVIEMNNEGYLDYLPFTFNVVADILEKYSLEKRTFSIH